MDFSAYEFSSLREDQFTLHRGLSDRLEPILLVACSDEYPSPLSLQRLEHEHALRADLDAEWAVRPVELVRHEGRLILVLEDPGGEPLERMLGRPMDVSQLLRIAVPLASVIGRMHAQGLIHKDLKPANILVDASGGGVRLTGFGFASRLPRERQGPGPPEGIAGTLAYMAPEQTGRMNRSVDSRSDLYACGVTLYEMLTGVLPFSAADPMEWIHCHIARQPMPPSERLNGVPASLSAIVMKLLAKSAEDRYQTAAGLEADLRRCRAEWEAHGRIEPFPVGTRDASERLVLPERLYGREREIDALLAAFDRVVADGATELVLVSGYSGIGKSSVVNELHKALVSPRGLFASGKFDQYKRDIPYATLAQAFQSLVRHILGKGEVELGEWRDALWEALGANGGLIVNLVPELELLIGKQPPVADLPPQDAKNRFQMVFRRFLGVFARREHPLALFLDDLQWLDAATLDLLEHLVTHSEAPHLLLVGAYRDNEVGPTHPLLRTLKAIRKADGNVHEIVLAPLGYDDVGRLVSEGLHCGPERARPLARLVYEKTGGNPFFAIQFITALAEEGLLAFDPVAPVWRWDMDRIRAKGYTDNVVDLMVEKLERLSASTQKTLKLVSCLGNVAEVTSLAMVQGDVEEAIHTALWEAVHAGLVIREEGAYKFLHDRIQQAAYSLILEENRADTHLRIGRAMLASMPPDVLAERLFEIVNQLNRGTLLITEQGEREQLAEFNLIAGKRAKASTAYASALSYLIAGTTLLAEDCWECRHELIFALELGRAECEFLTGALAEAEQRLAALSARAANTVERASVACLRVDLYVTLAQSSRAIAVGLDYLRHLGVDWSLHPTEEEARQAYERIWSQLGGRTIEELVDLPLMSDPASLATLDVLARLGAPAGQTDANLFALISCRAASFSIDQGNCDASCAAYVQVGMLAGARFGDYQAAYRFGRLGYELVERHGLKRFQATAYLLFGHYILPQTRHVRVARDPMRRAFAAASNSGDFTHASYACDMMIANSLTAGVPLVEVQREVEHGLAFAQKAQFGLVIDIIAAQLGLVRTLRALTPNFGSFDDDQFDERRIERRFSENPDLGIAECWYWIRKLQARFLAGDYASAIEASSRAHRLLWKTSPLLERADYHFYAALSRAASYGSAPPDQRQQYLEAVASHHSELAVWAEHCAENFENRAALVSAEVARIEGRDADAMRLYEQAIQSARKHGFVQNEGVAHEVAARFYTERGIETVAHACLRNARYCYLRWGAEGKVRQLEQLHPHLREHSVQASPTAAIGAKAEQLDIGAVIKASQAVSTEIVLDRLIETLMTVALEDAGAERGLLVLMQGDTPHIEAAATTDQKSVMVTVRQEGVTPAAVPESLLNTVIRMRQSVILDDASAQNPFSADPYIRDKRARSILCLPLLKQSQLIGVLYLENNLASHVFTPARISLLELLASQAAISLENARLYGELLMSEERWRKLFESVPVGIGLIGSHRRYVATNPTFQRMTGYSEAELRGLSPIDITHEDDRTASEAIVTASIAGGPLAQRIEKRYRHKDGGITWAEVSLFPALMAGSARQLGAIAVDVTERKRAEAELRESAQRYREVETALAHANRVATMGQLTASIAHEVSQPIHAVAINAQAASLWLAAQPPDLEEVGKILARIVENSNRAGDVIDRIRALVKKAPQRKDRLKINGAIREVIELTRGETEKNGVSVRTQLADDLPLVQGDRVQLQQVILNLIVNALQAMSGVGDGARELLISTRTAGSDGVLVTVRDTGPGLPPSSLERLFEAFYTTKPDGMGMGLSICRSIIEAHGGRLWASENLPRGAVFQFTAPAYAGEES